MSYNRAFEDGYRCVTMVDPAGRRGLWFRYRDNVLEVCSGREGDDAYARFEGEQARQLADVLEYPTHQFEEHCMSLIDLFQMQGDSYLTAKRKASDD